MITLGSRGKDWLSRRLDPRERWRCETRRSDANAHNLSSISAMATASKGVGGAWGVGRRAHAGVEGEQFTSEHTVEQ